MASASVNSMLERLEIDRHEARRLYVVNRAVELQMGNLAELIHEADDAESVLRGLQLAGTSLQMYEAVERFRSLIARAAVAAATREWTQGENLLTLGEAA